MWFAEIEHFKGDRSEILFLHPNCFAGVLFSSSSLEYVWFNVSVSVRTPSQSLIPVNPSQLDGGLPGCSLAER